VPYTTAAAKVPTSRASRSTIMTRAPVDQPVLSDEPVLQLPDTWWEERFVHLTSVLRQKF
jgi:hypothetical protein